VEGNSADDTWGEILRVKEKYPQKNMGLLPNVWVN
jgi:hypothetical protein